MKFKSILLVTAAAVWLCCGALFAQEGSVDKAKAHFDKALKLYNSGKYEKALSEFKTAYHIHPHWKIRYNMAKCHYKLNHYVEAAEGFRAFIDEGGDEIPEKQKEKAHGYLAELKKKLGTLKLIGKREGLLVSIDGREKKEIKEGMEFFVLPGEHFIAVTLEARLVMEKKISFKGGDSKEISVKVVEIPRVEKEGNGKEESGEKSGSPAGKKGPAGIAAWAALGAAAAFLVAGAATGGSVFKQKRLQEDAEDEYMERYDVNPGDPELDKLKKSMDDHYGRAKDLAVSTNILLGVGCGLAATSAALFIIIYGKDKKERKSGIQHAVTAGPGSMALEINFY